MSSLAVIPLGEVAHARSGDKGDTANIGVIAYAPDAYEWLARELTAERVKAHFSRLCEGTVTRYDLPNLHAFNFVLTKALGGGGSRSLRRDAQGKGYGQLLLAMTLPAPPPGVLEASRRARSAR